MCTVTYYPQKNGYILTHNRDEKLWRPMAIPPQVFDNQFIFPTDPHGNGTWILNYPKGSVSLINGAFVKHQPNPPYKFSRGLILRNFSLQPDCSFHEYITNFDLTGIEPFTLISVVFDEKKELTVYVWDSERLHNFFQDAEQPQIWSAVTVYPQEIIEERKIWWNEWLQNHEHVTAKQIFDFHLHGGKGNPRSNLRMFVAGEGQTVSISQVIHYQEHRTFIYKDLVTSSVENVILF